MPKIAPNIPITQESKKADFLPSLSIADDEKNIAINAPHKLIDTGKVLRLKSPIKLLLAHFWHSMPSRLKYPSAKYLPASVLEKVSKLTTAPLMPCDKSSKIIFLFMCIFIVDLGFEVNCKILI